MNKVLLLSDKEQLPKGAFELACSLNKQEPILLTGVFLPQVDYWDSLVYTPYGTITPWLNYVPEPKVSQEHAIEQFRKQCEQNGIEYRVHDKEYLDVKKEIRIESRFADLIILGSDSFYASPRLETFDEYTENTLHHAECPVVVVPESFEQPDHLVITYDGSPSSAYAIKQFAYIMPQLSALPALLVYVNPDSDKDFPDKTYIEELAKRHYPSLSLLKLDIEPKKFFKDWLSGRKNTLLVTGSRGRSELSELFHKSFMSDTLKDQQLPVFIAHR